MVSLPIDIETVFVGLGVLIAVLQLAIVYLLTKRQLYHGDEQIRLLTIQIKNQNDWGKRRESLSFSMSQNSNMIEARNELDKVFQEDMRGRKPIPYKVILEKIETDPNVYTHIRTLLSHFEVMAIAVLYKVADSEVSFDLSAESLRQYAGIFDEFIQHHRVVNLRAYEHMQMLNVEWQQRMEREQIEGRRRVPELSSLLEPTKQRAPRKLVQG